jgi:hypothetical protein
VLADTVAEASETVGVRITSAGALRIADAVGIVTIRDAESSDGVSIGDAAVREGDARRGAVKLAVVLATPRSVDTTIGYKTVDATARAPGDYRTRSGRVRIRAGRTAATVTPTVIGDVIAEPDETFQVVLTGTGTSGVAVSDPVGTVTIRSDENPPVPPAPPAPPTLGAPAGLAVVAGPTPRHLTAEWSAPAGTAPITGYDLEVTRGTTLNVVPDVTAPFVFGCGLAEVTDTCSVRVRAKNAQGDGPWSGAVTASTWSPPDAPPNLTVLAGGGAVTWEVPASDLPIDGYEVQKRPLGGISWTHVDTTTLTHAATTCGNCSVRVRAHSDVGFGAWSTVDIALPGAPSALTAIRDEANHELVHLGWSPPSDPGSHPVTSYAIFVNGFPLSPTTETTADVFLRSTVAWQIEVYAENLIGRGVFPATLSLPAG